MIAGRPMMSRAGSASAKEWARMERGVSRPMRFIASRKSSRSSAMSIASAVAPIISTSKRSSTPMRRSDSAVLSAVWPPIVGSSAKPPFTFGRSTSMMRATTSGVIGSM